MMAPLSEPRLARNDTLPAVAAASVVEDFDDTATSLLEAVLVSEAERLLMSAAVDSLVAALVSLPSTMMYSLVDSWSSEAT